MESVLGCSQGCRSTCCDDRLVALLRASATFVDELDVKREHRGAPPSMVGGNRGLWSLRIPLEHVGTRVYPDMFSLAQAHLVLKADGNINDLQLQQRFEDNVANFMELVEASKLYPCVKKASVEFLGERVDRHADRVQTAGARRR